jgi:hypothetical protein
MKTVLAILLVAGCGVPRAPSTPDADPKTSVTTFAHDTYYTGVVSPYSTPEACEASDPNPIMCHLELGFCAGGMANFSNYDLPLKGEYHLEGPIVIATFHSNSVGGEDDMIQLDTRTGHASANAMTSTYILDTVGRWSTLQFDVEPCPSAQ